MLWHEYTHVVTLGLTRNKIPRWLSEGISVHEELARDPTWGQRMTPRYREMILGGELAPIAKLSGAFLSPRTPEHLVFAYYQSALVVEFLVQRFGQEALRAVLRDLGRGGGDQPGARRAGRPPAGAGKGLRRLCPTARAKRWPPRRTSRSPT